MAGRQLQDRKAQPAGDDPPQLVAVRGPAPLGHLPRARLHHQGVHAQHNRD